MGPFELMDLISHDVNFKSPRRCTRRFWGRQIQTQPHPTPAGRCPLVGAKTGRGFYTYGESKEATPSGVAVEGVSERILAMLMNEAADAVFWQVGSAEAIDLAMQKGVNYPKAVSGLGR